MLALLITLFFRLDFSPGMFRSSFALFYQETSANREIGRTDQKIQWKLCPKIWGNASPGNTVQNNGVVSILLLVLF